MSAITNHPEFLEAFARSEKWFRSNGVWFRPLPARETETVFPALKTQWPAAGWLALRKISLRAQRDGGGTKPRLRAWAGQARAFCETACPGGLRGNHAQRRS